MPRRMLLLHLAVVSQWLMLLNCQVVVLDSVGLLVDVELD